MQDESGFFSDVRPSTDLEHGFYHDFRQMTVSASGWCRVMTARRHGRTFIVKTLKDEFRDNNVAETALRKEFEAGTMVESPYIVRTLDFINMPDYGNAIILEYCPGLTLRELIEQRQLLTAIEVDRMVDDLSKGILHLHKAGIIHRDLKPDNIICTRLPLSVKIIDLGLADSESFYLFRHPAGTPGYVPSDRMADDAVADARNDLYALGVILSQLYSIVPPSRRKALSQLSRLLTSGRITSAEHIMPSFRRLMARRRLCRASLIAMPALSIIAIALIIKYTTPTPAVATPRPTEDSLIEAPDTTAIEPQSTSRPVAIPAPRRATSIPVDETVAGEGGVTLEEAKYADNFNRSEFDAYVVKLTDSVFFESFNTVCDGSQPVDLRRECYDRLNSPQQISELVITKVFDRYPDGDLRRARGLIGHRYQLNHSTYRLPRRP